MRNLPSSMAAMLLDAPGRILRKAELPVPRPQGHDILIRRDGEEFFRHVAHGEVGTTVVRYPLDAPGR